MSYVRVLPALLVIPLLVAACAVTLLEPPTEAPAPPPVPVESAMEGVFSLTVMLEQDAKQEGIEVLECSDPKKQLFSAYQGNGTTDITGESILTLRSCLDRVFVEVKIGVGTLTSEDGDDLYLSFTGQGGGNAGLSVDYEITGGTGKYAGASGQGEIYSTTVNAGASSATRDFILTGTITIQ